MDIQTET